MLQEQQKQKYFQEQVIINHPIHVIAKSRKGDEVMVLNSGDLQMVPSMNNDDNFNEVPTEQRIQEQLIEQDNSHDHNQVIEDQFVA